MRTIHILIAVLIFAMVSMPIMAEETLKEGTDYTCVDKEKNIASPPPNSENLKTENADIYKPLCGEGKVPKNIDNGNKEVEKKLSSLSTVKMFESGRLANSKEASKETGLIDCTACLWIYSAQWEANQGAFARISQHNPYVDPEGYSTISGMAVVHYVPIAYNTYSSVDVGWRKSIYDGGIKLYTRWVDENVIQGYNADYGWVQSSSLAYPGMSISGSGEKDYQIENFMGNWWVVWNRIWLGYYPSSIWDQGFSQGDAVYYYGEVTTPYALYSATDMGNGLFASNTNAAKMYNMKYLSKYSMTWTNADIYQSGSNYGLYSATRTSSNSMRYGGPGVGITVSSPNGGESWTRGTSKEIKWISTANPSVHPIDASPGPNVKIELLKGTAVNRVISPSTTNDGSYYWAIPSTQTLGTDYRIRVTSTDKPKYKDTSNSNFAIVSTTSSIRVVSPNGGESWRRGTNHAISWIRTGSTGANVRIQLYKGGSLVRTISSGTPNDGSFSWSIPWTQAIGSDYKIKISSTTTSYNDWSNSNFRIY